MSAAVMDVLGVGAAVGIGGVVGDVVYYDVAVLGPFGGDASH